MDVDRERRLTTVPKELLAEALGLGPAARHHVALVGGGGKTTLTHAIGEALDGPTVLTCTTKMGADQHWGRPMLVAPTDDELACALSEHHAVLVVGAVDGQKAVGIDRTRADELFALGYNVVAESDGSRRKPAKAPDTYEPVIASTVTMVVAVIGADALDGVIGEVCHRPQLVAALLGCDVNERLTPERAAVLVTSSDGGRRSVPDGARFVVCLNKVNSVVAASAERFVAEVEARGERALAIRHVDGW